MTRFALAIGTFGIFAFASCDRHDWEGPEGTNRLFPKDDHHGDAHHGDAHGESHGDDKHGDAHHGDSDHAPAAEKHHGAHDDHSKKEEKAHH